MSTYKVVEKLSKDLEIEIRKILLDLQRRINFTGLIDLEKACYEHAFHEISLYQKEPEIAKNIEVLLALKEDLNEYEKFLIEKDKLRTQIKIIYKLLSEIIYEKEDKSVFVNDDIIRNHISFLGENSMDALVSGKLKFFLLIEDFSNKIVETIKNPWDLHIWSVILWQNNSISYGIFKLIQEYLLSSSRDIRYLNKYKISLSEKILNVPETDDMLVRHFYIILRNISLNRSLSFDKSGKKLIDSKDLERCFSVVKHFSDLVKSIFMKMTKCIHQMFMSHQIYEIKEDEEKIKDFMKLLYVSLEKPINELEKILEMENDIREFRDLAIYNIFHYDTEIMRLDELLKMFHEYKNYKIKV